MAMGDVPLTNFGSVIHAVQHGDLDRNHPAVVATPPPAKPSNEEIPTETQLEDETYVKIVAPTTRLNAAEMRSLTFTGQVKRTQ